MTPFVPVFLGHVTQEGRVRLDDKFGMQQEALRLAGEEIELVIRKRRNQRSSQANRYYHGVVVKLLAEYCGYEHDDMHEALAMKFLRIDDCPITGVPRRKRTPATNTAEFADYIDRCIRFAAELGVVIPDSSRSEAA